MNKFELIFIKVKEGSDYHLNLEKQYKSNNIYYHNANAEDIKLVESLDSKKYTTIFLLFDTEYKVNELYIANSTPFNNAKGWSLKCDISLNTKKKLIIDNIISCSEIDLEKDYSKYNYIILEQSNDLYNQVMFLINKPYVPKRNYTQVYKNLDEENNLSEYAQKNRNYERFYGVLEPQEDRGEFQRDYERIIHSKAFTRMVDKAQIFTPEKGDYYRTRMTHTLVVNQIACGIAKTLKLNHYLTSAIALGHDLGHTPFGHQGERSINEILSCEEIIVNSKTEDNAFGGFKHNYQSLRVVCKLEEEYIEYEGLDLSFQALEGILKHTKTNNKDCKECDKKEKKCDKCYDINEFVEYSDKLFVNQSFSTTLEGQIVAIADEIAQRGHDLDDALSANLITIEDLDDYLSLKKMTELKSEIDNIQQKLKEVKENNRIFINEEALIQSRISSRIIHFFIQDVCKNSVANMEKYGYKNFAKNNNRQIAKDKNDKPIISFSKIGKIFNDYLEKIITKKAINSLEVSMFDNNANKIIKGLFKEYYNNPKLLHDGTICRIYKDIRAITENVVDFANGDYRIVQKEWENITNKKIPVDLKERTEEDCEYWEKRKIFVRNLTDFNAGMTDTYALNEYKKHCNLF